MIARETCGLVDQHMLTKVLEKFGMENAEPVTTPTDISNKLTKAGEGEERFDQTNQQSIVCFISTRTRPDIYFAVSDMVKFCSEPTRHHWTAVKRILRYLKGTLNLGLL